VSWYLSLALIVLGWLLKVFYDWKIHPAITKSHRKQEKRDIEEEERNKKIKQEKIDELNRIWRMDRESLRKIQQPLREFNQMNRFPDTYRAKKCMELASDIEREAYQIQQPEYKEIKEKLLEYARRKNQIDQNTPLNILMGIFQKRIEPNKFEPLVLHDEIEENLRSTSTPPFSEKDL
jgi:protein-tyrosine-phosphatase